MTCGCENQLLSQLKRTHVGDRSTILTRLVISISGRCLISDQLHHSLGRHRKERSRTALVLIPEQVRCRCLYAHTVIRKTQRLGFVDHLIQQTVRVLFPLGLLFFDLFRGWLLSRLILGEDGHCERNKREGKEQEE